MRVSYDKDVRKAAKDENKMLCTFQITFPGGKGGITSQGFYGPNTMKEIKGYIDSIFTINKNNNSIKEEKK